ncbi:MAG: VWA domain-containing protein [Myxococcota bacterium]
MRLLTDPAIRRMALFVPLCLAILLQSCASGAKMTIINSEQKKPNNVWVFFTVEKGKEPVPGLEAEDFRIYEDDGLVSAYESKQVIQNPEVAAVMYTLLLLDVSGSITESGQIDRLVDAAQLFTERVGKTQKVGVYAFDGEERIHAVVPFTASEGSVKGGLEGLRGYSPKDPSTNLHGAVVEGLKTLQKGLEREKKPLKFGTLVVFSDGADRAARVSREEMKQELNKEEYDNYELFAIGIGDEKELEQAQLDDIGRDGTEYGKDDAKVVEIFERVALRIEAQTKRFYLLSYCTPARAGEHKVRIEVDVKDAGGAKAEYTFDAKGFGPPPECDPERKPTFRLDDIETQDATEAGPRKKSSGGRFQPR